ncbi:adenylyl-sulfate kinase [Xanthovirga aplysinae]|uniref:adenylyl-sulfate kinase n=1 Tax=Xanthovirga aplysinae TaxID=2529853 RepID=UPI0012BC81C5|nr:adenylyl-sulfate kinase [Xanthovirga aplysinae]MTI32258.1 adenylyl-sulfate kinase [Xanthovirga aplysinae]
MDNDNIIPHDHKIRKVDRNTKYKHASFVVWFTGLSGSGKSTLAGALENKLFDEGYHTYILDGDNVRRGLNKDLGFSATSRTENIRRIGEVCKLFVDAGIIVLSAFVSPIEVDRQKVRNLVGKDNFVEVFVDCPVEVCEQRDVKGLYKKARTGEVKEFTGISSPFEKPVAPDVIIKSDQQSIEESVLKVCEVLKSKI